jgi:hypothetical protein
MLRRFAEKTKKFRQVVRTCIFWCLAIGGVWCFAHGENMLVQNTSKQFNLDPNLWEPLRAPVYTSVYR